VDDHLGIVLLSPLLDVFVVEPLVVAGHEVVPLQDTQRLLRGEGFSGKCQRRSTRTGHLNQFTTGKGHRRPLLQWGRGQKHTQPQLASRAENFCLGKKTGDTATRCPPPASSVFPPSGTRNKCIATHSRLRRES